TDHMKIGGTRVCGRPRTVAWELLAGGRCAAAQGDQRVHDIGAVLAEARGAHAQNVDERSHGFLLAFVRVEPGWARGNIRMSGDEGLEALERAEEDVEQAVAGHGRAEGGDQGAEQVAKRTHSESPSMRLGAKSSRRLEPGPRGRSRKGLYCDVGNIASDRLC